MVGLFPIFAIGILFILFGLGYLVGRRYDHSLMGVIIGVGSFILILGGYVLVLFMEHCWQPMIPKCKNNKCRKDADFELLEIKSEGWYYQCRCGTKYLLKKRGQHGRQFMELLSDGTTKPYMKHTRFGRWRPDSSL